MLPLGKLNISIFNSYLCHRRFLHRQKRTTHFCNRNVNLNFTSEFFDISAYKTDKSFMCFPVTTRSEGLSLICDGDIIAMKKIYLINILDKSDV